MSPDLRNIQDKIACLKKKKRRITPQLMEVLRIINVRDAHFSVSDIYNDARKTFPSISLNTVYCILKKLHSIGELQEIITLSKGTNYCLNPKAHHHVVCNKCKKIDDVEADLFDINSIGNTVKTDYKIGGYSILFNGLCKNCNNGS